MNKNLETRFRLFVTGMDDKMGPFGSTYWNSSAQKLENNLKAAGIILPIKLYHRYKFPGGASPQKYMNYLGYLNFCRYVNEIEEQKQKILDSDKFLESEKDIILKELAKNAPFYRNFLRDELAKLQELNPELRDFKETKDTDVFNIVAGAVFGFALKEIEYYCHHWDSGNLAILGTQEKINTALEPLGFVAGYILAPETVDIIISALEKRKQSVMINNVRHQERK